MRKSTWMILAFLLACPSYGAGPDFVNDYEKATSTKDKNVLVIIGTEWCGGCVRLKEALKSANLDDYVVCVVDAEERKDISKKHSVSAYPTSVILFNKEEMSRKKGYEKSSYDKWLEKNRRPSPNRKKCECSPDCKCGDGCGKGGKCDPECPACKSKKAKSCSCGCDDCKCSLLCPCGCYFRKLMGGEK